MDTVTYVKEECVRDGVEISGTQPLLRAVDMLKNISVASSDEMEIEMYIMHAAHMVDDRNEFVDNFNVTRKDIFMDHVVLVKEADPAAWTRKLFDFGCWPHANRRICNLVWNWLRGSLDDPERIF